jgi:hypothetical protein
MKAESRIIEYLMSVKKIQESAVIFVRKWVTWKTRQGTLCGKIRLHIHHTRSVKWFRKTKKAKIMQHFVSWQLNTVNKVNSTLTLELHHMSSDKHFFTELDAKNTQALQPWRWRQYVSPKCWHLPMSLHSAQTQRTSSVHKSLCWQMVKCCTHKELAKGQTDK